MKRFLFVLLLISLGFSYVCNLLDIEKVGNKLVCYVYPTPQGAKPMQSNLHLSYKLYDGNNYKNKVDGSLKIIPIFAVLESGGKHYYAAYPIKVSVSEMSYSQNSMSFQHIVTTIMPIESLTAGQYVTIFTLEYPTVEVKLISNDYEISYSKEDKKVIGTMLWSSSRLNLEKVFIIVNGKSIYEKNIIRHPIIVVYSKRRANVLINGRQISRIRGKIIYAWLKARKRVLQGLENKINLPYWEYNGYYYYGVYKDDFRCPWYIDCSKPKPGEVKEIRLRDWSISASYDKNNKKLTVTITGAQNPSVMIKVVKNGKDVYKSEKPYTGTSITIENLDLDSGNYEVKVWPSDLDYSTASSKDLVKTAEFTVSEESGGTGGGTSQPTYYLKVTTSSDGTYFILETNYTEAFNVTVNGTNLGQYNPGDDGEVDINRTKVYEKLGKVNRWGWIIAGNYVLRFAIVDPNSGEEIASNTTQDSVGKRVEVSLEKSWIKLGENITMRIKTNFEGVITINDTNSVSIQNYEANYTEKATRLGNLTYKIDYDSSTATVKVVVYFVLKITADSDIDSVEVNVNNYNYTINGRTAELWIWEDKDSYTVKVYPKQSGKREVSFTFNRGDVQNGEYSKTISFPTVTTGGGGGGGTTGGGGTAGGGTIITTTTTTTSEKKEEEEEGTVTEEEEPPIAKSLREVIKKIEYVKGTKMEEIIRKIESALETKDWDKLEKLADKLSELLRNGEKIEYDIDIFTSTNISVSGYNVTVGKYRIEAYFDYEEGTAKIKIKLDRTYDLVIVETPEGAKNYTNVKEIELEVPIESYIDTVNNLEVYALEKVEKKKEEKVGIIGRFIAPMFSKFGIPLGIIALGVLAYLYGPYLITRFRIERRLKREGKITLEELRRLGRIKDIKRAIRDLKRKYKLKMENKTIFVTKPF